MFYGVPPASTHTNAVSSRCVTLAKTHTDKHAHTGAHTIRRQCLFLDANSNAPALFLTLFLFPPLR